VCWNINCKQRRWLEGSAVGAARRGAGFEPFRPQRFCLSSFNGIRFPLCNPRGLAVSAIRCNLRSIGVPASFPATNKIPRILLLHTRVNANGGSNMLDPMHCCHPDTFKPKGGSG
jgi:hypothetical protein